MKKINKAQLSKNTTNNTTNNTNNTNAIEAVAVMSNSNMGINGEVLFKEDLIKHETIIKIKITGLKPNSEHGFHIHTKGDLREGCKSLCSHYNPFNAIHGDLSDNKANRHVGDLGNLKANNKGVVNTTIRDKLVKLRGKYSVVGRSVILHEGKDDLGLGDNEESLKTGNSGSRIACGIIGYA